MPDYPAFGKIPRLHKDVVITEKIDGTNALVRVYGESQIPDAPAGYYHYAQNNMAVAAGSRNRWVSANDDNHGFARWVWDNADDLTKLGPGVHHGEWWGSGINRGYGLKEKCFSLFNATKWAITHPACCSVVPVLRTTTGDKLNLAVTEALLDLDLFGSRAAPGFARPEGVVVYHTAGNALFKVTFEGDRAKNLVFEEKYADIVSRLEPTFTKPAGVIMCRIDESVGAELVAA